MSRAQVELVQLEATRYIGIAVTSSLRSVEGVAEAHQQFLNRMSEIPDRIDDSTYVCVHFANEILFTYLYCMEVTSLDSIPVGMIGFEVPARQYVKVHSNGQEPYSFVEKYLQERGLRSDSNALAFERFQFGKAETKYHAEILVPFTI
ncbi:GyrI-like domain-containing protein [Paenibacillus koleovorans]|uniref:GyrI-like domain-containing protein n=1 Tax=Paenibacillus koleovorans TaxID=121608 RepID=UPI000FDCB53A|nr:effector binding domain-containing protein [Paenibacillus koleovorans]